MRHALPVDTMVLPVAGLGKRLLPLTLTTPKNLIPVNGKPLLEYVLEEAVEAGIRHAVLIVNPKHRADFERYVASRRKRFASLRFHVRVQLTPAGNGHAILQAHDLLAGKAFVVRFCDDIVQASPSVTTSLISLYRRCRAPVLLLERVPKALVPRFGVVGVKKGGTVPAPQAVGGKVHELTRIVEKPKLEDAPSNLTIVGGYLLTPDILRNLRAIADSLSQASLADDALPLAIALQVEFIIGGKIYGWEFPGKRLDCGTIESLEKAEKAIAANIKPPRKSRL